MKRRSSLAKLKIEILSVNGMSDFFMTEKSITSNEIDNKSAILVHSSCAFGIFDFRISERSKLAPTYRYCFLLQIVIFVNVYSNINSDIITYNLEGKCLLSRSQDTFLILILIHIH